MPSNTAKTQTGIGRQAIITYRSGLFEVKLYNTYIYSEEGNEITLDNGGWITPTTVRYMNQALGYREAMGRVTIKGGEMFFNGKPFVNGKYVTQKALTQEAR